MAVYYLTYKEFSDYIDECISSSARDKELLKAHKAEIISAFLNEYDTSNEEQNESIQDLVELWQNQISNPSEILLGKRYIAVQSSMLSFLKAFLLSGIVDDIIRAITTGTKPEVGITAAIGIAIAICDIFRKTKKLDDWDFCVFLQARAHFHEHREFTIDDLKTWFPHDDNKTCNMHNNMWSCSYYKNTDDTCEVIPKIEHAIKSLLQKDILKITSYRDGKEYYQFVK